MLPNIIIALYSNWFAVLVGFLRAIASSLKSYRNTVDFLSPPA